MQALQGFGISSINIPNLRVRCGLSKWQSSANPNTAFLPGFLGSAESSQSWVVLPGPNLGVFDPKICLEWGGSSPGGVGKDRAIIGVWAGTLKQCQGLGNPINAGKYPKDALTPCPYKYIYKGVWRGFVFAHTHWEYLCL